MGSINFDQKIFDTSMDDSSAGTLTSYNALMSAIRMWLFSHRGDYIGNPARGGILTGIIGKPMYEGMESTISQKISYGLSVDFADEKIQVVYLTVEALYDEHKWRLHLGVYSDRLKVQADLNEDIAGA